MAKTSFLLHHDSLDILKDMTDKMAGKFIKAIYQYQTTGELPEMDMALKMAIKPFINQFTRDGISYEKTVARNTENGKKGGRPTKPTETKDNPEKPSGFIENPQEPKKPDSDSVSDKDSVNDSGKDKDPKKRKKPPVVFVPPELSEVETYFEENGYHRAIAKKFYEGYRNGSPPWTDSKGNAIRSWKQKAQQVWFKDENKNNGTLTTITKTGSGNSRAERSDNLREFRQAVHNLQKTGD